METDHTPLSDPAAPGEAGIAGLQPGAGDLEKRLDALIEARLEAVEARRREASRESWLARFDAAHPDFRKLVASGALEARKRDNPLLDDVGAYFVHRLEAEREAGVAALAKAREEAAARAEAETLGRLRHKGLARTMGAAPVGDGRGREGEPELAAPEKFGGVNAVLAARLTARRQTEGI